MNQKSAYQIWQLLSVAVFINALLSTAFILSAVPTDIWLSNLKSSVFLPAALIAHFSFLFFLIALIAQTAYLLRFRNTKWKSLILISFSALLLIVITDAQVFSLYRFHLNSMSINLLFGGAANQILSFSMAMWLSIAAIIIVIIGIEYLLLKWLLQQDRITGNNVWPAILMLMLSTQLFYGFKDAVADTSITMQLRYIPWAQPLTMKRSLRKWGWIDATAKQPSLKTKRHSSIDYPKSPMQCSNPKELNYLLLVVDSVRADMLNAEVMPNTYDFSQNAMVFNQHYSTSNSTRFGMFGLFYGLPPTYWFDMLKEQKGSVLFDALKDHGYKFHLDASAPLNSPEFDRTIFSEVRDELQWVTKKSEIEKDTVVINRLLKFLDSDHQNNFFALSFIDAPHGYKLPKGERAHFQPALKQINYLTLNNDTDPEEFKNLYKSTIHYNDRLLGLVYEKLAEKNLLSNTVVIITSDHGQEFNDLKQNYWGHNSNFSAFQTKVPLIIHWPQKQPEQIASVTSHEDIVPSLLSEGLNCKNNISDYSTGYSLFDPTSWPNKRNLLLANWNMRAIFTGDSYYNFPPVGSMEVLDENYRLKSDQSTDPLIIQDNLQKMGQYLK